MIPEPKEAGFILIIISILRKRRRLLFGALNLSYDLLLKAAPAKRRSGAISREKYATGHC